MSTNIRIDVLLGDDEEDQVVERAPLRDALASLNIPDTALCAGLGATVPPFDAEDSSSRLGITAAADGLRVDPGALWWLLEDEGEDAELARALVLGDGDPSTTACGPSVSERLEEGAGWYAAQHADERLVALAANGRGAFAAAASWRLGRKPSPTRRSQVRQPVVGAAAGSHDHLAAMLAAGMSAAQLAPLALGDADGLKGDDLIEILGPADIEVVRSFLSGQTARRPRPGEILALVPALECGDDLTAGIGQIRDALVGLPWHGELVEALPGLLISGVSTEEAWGAYGALARRFGRDGAKSWERAFDLAPGWSDSIAALADAARGS